MELDAKFFKLPLSWKFC